MGHSTGGGGVVQLSLEDKRISSVLGMDPWVEPIGMEQLSKGLKIPSLFLRSEEWKDRLNEPYLKELVQSSENNRTLQVNKITHQDFVMNYMFWPMNELFKVKGELDTELFLNLRDDYVLNFFDTTLKNKDIDLGLLESRYPTGVKPINYNETI